MKVLITGANGQVGWELKNQANLNNFDLYALDRKSLDITNKKMIEKQVIKLHPDIIVNAAAYTSVDMAEKEDLLAYQVNSGGPEKLAVICNKLSIFLIHISTDYVFNGCKKGSYNEDDITDPLNIYGMTKLKGEEAIRRILDRHLILRTSWVFGSHGKNFVKTIINLAKQKNDLSVIEDQHGCPTSAKSIAQVIFNICDKYRLEKEIKFGTYHYTNTPTTTWYLFAKKILQVAYEENLIKNEVKISQIASKDYFSGSRKPKNSTLSSKKIQQDFGIVSKPWITDLENVIRNLH